MCAGVLGGVPEVSRTVPTGTRTFKQIRQRKMFQGISAQKLREMLAPAWTRRRWRNARSKTYEKLYDVTTVNIIEGRLRRGARSKDGQAAGGRRALLPTAPDEQPDCNLTHTSRGIPLWCPPSTRRHGKWATVEDLQREMAIDGVGLWRSDIERTLLHYGPELPREEATARRPARYHRRRALQCLQYARPRQTPAWERYAGAVMSEAREQLRGLLAGFGLEHDHRLKLLRRATGAQEAACSDLAQLDLSPSEAVERVDEIVREIVVSYEIDWREAAVAGTLRSLAAGDDE